VIYQSVLFENSDMFFGGFVGDVEILGGGSSFFAKVRKSYEIFDQTVSPNVF
jgi:hypothetical protein